MTFGIAFARLAAISIPLVAKRATVFTVRRLTDVPPTQALFAEVWSSDHLGSIGTVHGADLA